MYVYAHAYNFKKCKTKFRNSQGNARVECPKCCELPKCLRMSTKINSFTWQKCIRTHSPTPVCFNVFVCVNVKNN